MAKFQRIMELFTQNVVTSSQKYEFGIRDPRSGIRNKPIPDPGSRGQKDTQSWIPDPDPQHCYQESFLWSEPQRIIYTEGPQS